MVQLQTTQLSLPPGMIHLGVGQPSPGLLPLGLIRKAAEHRLNQPDSSLLAYGAEQGDGYFRAALAQFLSDQYGEAVNPEHLFVTAGASQGLDLICTVFAKTGDTIFVEEPSYFLALRIFADHHLNIVSIPTDAEGLDVDALEAKLAIHSPVLVYTIPTYHNPGSFTMPQSRRERLVQLSRRHNFIIVADEVYHLLSYAEPPPRPLACYAGDGHVLSLGSFSKILAPGLRLGWVQGTPDLLQRLIRSGLVDSGGGLNPFTSGVVKSAIELGLLAENIQYLRSVYRQRLAVLQTAIRQELPGSTTFLEAKGGFFLWLKLPEGADTGILLKEARQENVAFLPGTLFSSRAGLNNYMRLSFALYEEDDLKTGAQVLGRVLKQHLT